MGCHSLRHLRCRSWMILVSVWVDPLAPLAMRRRISSLDGPGRNRQVERVERVEPDLVEIHQRKDCEPIQYENIQDPQKIGI